MTKPLSQDLRVRVIAAVESGMSRRAAAERFGIAPSAAVKWMRRFRETGSPAPRPQGGDKRSGRIEAFTSVILDYAAATPDIRRDGQSARAPRARRARDDRGQRRRAALPAALQS